jgi:hypothetical protein
VLSSAKDGALSSSADENKLLQPGGSAMNEPLLHADIFHNRPWDDTHLGKSQSDTNFKAIVLLRTNVHIRQVD